MRRYLYLGVFSAGITTLAVELSASRLLGNYFGSSNLVWASIIGLILIYLAVGYTIGGKWADRSPEYRTFFQVLIWAALFIGLIPLISRPILRFASGAFDRMQSAAMIGALLSVLVLFSIPITLLGTASPFAIRIAIENKEDSGRTSGKIYAISTIGSFIGTFLPVLVLIPSFGTYRTFIIISLFLMLISLIGLVKCSGARRTLGYLWMPILVILLAYLGLQGFDKKAEGIIYEKESAYNYIQVQQINDYTILRLNEGQGIHSMYHPTKIDFQSPWEQVLSAPFFNSAPVPLESIHRVAILGFAGGTSANHFRDVFQNVVVDGFEIDPELIPVGYEFFGLQEGDLNLFIEDARWGIAHSDQAYQVISIDAFTPPYIPWHLTTQEFFQEVYDHLDASGVMVINVARIYEDRQLLNTLFQTIDSVFSTTFIVDIPRNFNSMIFASKVPGSKSNLIENYINLDADPTTHPLLLSTLETTVLNLQPAPEEGMILTDDKAPVEMITNRMIIDFFLSDQIGNLQ